MANIFGMKHAVDMYVPRPSNIVVLWLQIEYIIWLYDLAVLVNDCEMYLWFGWVVGDCCGGLSYDGHVGNMIINK